MSDKFKQNYQILPISKLQEDKNQPRTIFDKEAIQEMAATMQEHGTINPIEVDEKGVIVTGAMRYRAAKVAGLKEVPVRVLANLGKEERYIRQVVENLHRKNLTETENYYLVQKLRKMFPDKHQSELGKMIGKSHKFIERYVEVGRASKSLQSSFFQGKLGVDKVNELSYTPKEYKKELTKKVLKEDIHRDSIRRINEKIKGSEPKAVRKILNTNFSNMDTEQVSETLRRVAPNVLERPEVAFEELKNLVESLENFLSVNSNVVFSHSPYAKRVAVLLDNLRESIDSYMGATPKRIEITNNS